MKCLPQEALIIQAKLVLPLLLWYTKLGGYMLLRDSSTLACWCLDVCFHKEKEMAMSHRLEDLTTTVSDDPLPRREALRRLLGVVAGATLAAWLPEQALARPVAIPHAGRGTWSSTGGMNYTRAAHTATLLTKG